MVKHLLRVLHLRKPSLAVEVFLHHLLVEIQNYGAWFKAFITCDEGAEKLSGSLLYPLGLILSELFKYIEQSFVFYVVRRNLADFGQNFDGLPPHSPDLVVAELFEDRKDAAQEHLLF